MPIGSYNPSESVLGTSPTVSIASSGVGIIDGEFSEDCSRVGWFRGSELSFRSGRLDLKNREILEENVFSAVAVNLDNLPRGICMLLLLYTFHSCVIVVFVIEFNFGIFLVF